MLNIKRSTKKHLREVSRRALAVLLTVSMVSQTSPLAYAYPEAPEQQPVEDVVEQVEAAPETSQDAVEQMPEAQPVETAAPADDAENPAAEATVTEDATEAVSDVAEAVADEQFVEGPASDEATSDEAPVDSTEAVEEPADDATPADESASDEDAQESEDTVETSSSADASPVKPADEPADDSSSAEEPAADETTSEAEASSTNPVEELAPEVVVPEKTGDEGATEVKLGLVFEHTYITILNQTVAAPTESIDIPTGGEVKFAASSDAGYKLSEVRLENGEARALLEPDGDGLYVIDPAYAVKGTTLYVIAEATGGSDSVPEATAITEVNSQDTFSYEDDQVVVTARLTDPTAVPAGVVFKVTPVTPESTEYAYDAYMEALNNTAAEGKEYTPENTLLYDVAFLTPKTDEEGNAIEGEWVEVQLDKGQVNLEFSFKQSQLSSGIEAETSADVEINHLPLKDSVRAEADTTAAVTDVSASDIIVEAPKAVDVNVDTEQMTVSLDSLSIIAATNSASSETGKYVVRITGAPGADFGQTVGVMAEWDGKLWIEEPIQAGQDATLEIEGFYNSWDVAAKNGAQSYPAGVVPTIELYTYKPYNEGNLYGIDKHYSGDEINGVKVSIAAGAGVANISFDGTAAVVPEPEQGSTSPTEQGGTETTVSTESANGVDGAAYAIQVHGTDAGTGVFETPVYVFAKGNGDKWWVGGPLSAGEDQTLVIDRLYYQYDAVAASNGENKSGFAVESISSVELVATSSPNTYSYQPLGTKATIGGYEISLTKSATGATVDVSAIPYRVSLDLSGADTGALTGTYYVLASVSAVGQTYYALVPRAIDGSESALYSFENPATGATLGYAPGMAVDVRLVRTEGGDLTIGDALDGTGCAQLGTGYVVKNHIVGIAAENGSTRVTLRNLGSNATDHTANIQFFATDKTSPLSKLDAPALTDHIVALARLTPLGSGSKGTTVGWAIADVDTARANSTGSTSVQFGGSSFQACDTLGNATGDAVSFDPTAFDITVDIYTAPEGITSMNELLTLGTRSIEAYKFLSNEVSGDKRSSTIKLAEMSSNELTVQLNFQQPVTIGESDGWYVFVKLEHQSTQDTYVLKKVTVDNASSVTLSLDDFVDQNGNPVNEEYTGHEKGITVRLVKANGSSINVNSAMHGNNCTVGQEGGMVGPFKVSYGEESVSTSADGTRHVHTWPVELTNAYQAGDYLDYIDVLGNARYFGLVANVWHIQNDAETNAAVKTIYSGHQSGNMGGDKIGYVDGEEARQPWYIGQVNGGAQLIKSDPADIYAPRNQWSNIAHEGGSSKLSFHDTSYEGVAEYIDRMIGHASAMGAELASHNSFMGEGSGINPSGSSVTLDFTSYGPGTYYVPLDITMANGRTILSYLADSSGLHIKKNVDQTIVFNTSATNVTLNKYLVTNGDYPERGSDTLMGGGSSEFDVTASSIVWNMPNATTVNITGSTVGIYLAPQANVTVGGTSGGWMVANEITNTGGEWHSIWQRYDHEYEKTSASLTARKTLDGKEPGNKRFTFVLKDAAGNEIERAENSSAGVVSFDTELVFDKVGTYTYTITEIAGSDGSIEYDSTVHTATIVVRKGSGDQLVASTTYDNGSLFAPVFRNKTTQSTTGGLEVTKRVVSDNAADKTRAYSFTVTLSDTSISGTYGEMTFEGGVASFTLSDGETKTARDLPRGITYAVTEASVDGIVTTKTGDTGTIGGTVAKCVFTNTQGTGSLKIQKTVTENGGAPTTTGKSLLAGTYTFGIFTDEACTKPYKVEGVAKTVSLTIGNDGAWATSEEIMGMPAGDYWIKEDATTNGAAPVANPVKVKVIAGKVGNESVIASITNDVKTADLTVEKTVHKALSSESGKTFAFVIQLGNTSVNGTFGDMVFTNGRAEISVKGGESKTATGLPVGTTYTVTETSDPNFVADKTGVTGTLSADGAVASFVNDRRMGELEIAKTVVSDVAADQEQKFTFTVELSDKTIMGDFGDLKFTDGVATVEIVGTGTKKAIDLPTGIDYTVTEATVDGFTQTLATGATGTISATKSVAAFTNTRNKGGLVVSKEVISDASADKDVDFTFTVTLDDTSIAGDFGDMSFEDGVATFTLKDGETKTAEGLPVGMGFTVSEAAKTGFTTTSTGSRGTIPADAQAPATARFTNTREKGSLEISKRVVSDAAADLSQVFTFTITLGDDTINGTYDGVTFVDGVGIIELRHNESKVIGGLPTDIGYTVTEATPSGFDLTSKTGDVGTIATAKSTAAFTNTRKTGDLTVSKAVVSPLAADKDQSFTFKVKLSDKTISKAFDLVTMVDGEQVDGDAEVSVTNGEATITLKDKESKTIVGLPAGITYTVTEQNSTGYVVESTDATGSVTTDSITAAFTNTRETGKLEVTKHVSSNTSSDKQKDFSFTVELSDTTITGTYGGMEFEAGKASFTLRDGQSKIAEELPVGVGYTVTEETAAGFVTTKTGDTGSISTAKSIAVFTNTRDEGGLMVTKSVEGAPASDQGKKFTFTVELTGEGADQVTGEYGEMVFTAGKATFELGDTETKSASNLPKGLTYTVTETPDGDYDIIADGATGTIGEGETAAVAAFTNTHKTGGLEVSKTVVSDATADAGQEFRFTVTLGDTTVSGVKGGMTFANGVASFTLKGGESVTATELPSGISYQVSEATLDGFRLTGKVGDSGTIVEGVNQTVSFENTRTTGDLEISKTVVSDAAADATQEFAFTIGLSDKGITGTYSDVEFSGGVATITLKGGQKKVISGLPTGITYTVTETMSDDQAGGFDLTETSGASGTISETKSTAFFENTRKTGDLEISKTVVSDAAADATQEFTFAVTLTDSSINGTYGALTFTNGTASVTLKGGETKVATGLPTGIGYTVTETTNSDFVTTANGEAGMTTSGDITTARATAAFENTRKTGDLSVTKTVTSSTASDLTKDFTFTVTLSDKTITKTFGDMTFTEGVATFTLKNGETKTATGLPTGITYTVEETVADGFTTTKSGETGTITTALSEAKFANAHDEGGLVVSKEVVSPIAADRDKAFSFTVTLKDTTVNGTYGEMTFTNGVATFTLKNGETKTATGLAKGVGYTVTETRGESFVTTSTGATGTISDTNQTAAFTNTRKVGDLKLSKVLVSDATADVNQVFTFHVELGEAISGTYGDVTFDAGKATVTLKGGETKTATDLPVDITYTVTEDTVAGFQQTDRVGDTGTISTTASTATFTNTREKGNLELSKILVSDATADKDRVFSFTVELSDKGITGTFGDMTFESGVAHVTLKGGETKTAVDLPTGITYEVTEATDESFETVATDERGTITTTKSEATFTNTRKTGDLSVTKSVTSSTAADLTKDFTFTVTLSDHGITDTYGDMAFEGGVATVTLHHGQTATATGLPVGLTYRVTEANAEGFVLSSSSGATGEITTTKAAATFTNQRDEGGLTVSKTVVSKAAVDEDATFDFTVTLSGKGAADIDGSYGDMDFADGVATFALGNGQSVSATGLPTGLHYTVTEAEEGDFITVASGDTGTIGTQTSLASFTNTRKTGDLTISKALVSDAAADAEATYEFAVSLSDKTISGTFGDVTFEKGEATVSIQGAGTKTASDLPIGIGYAVTETADDDFTTVAEGVTGTIAVEKGTSTFTNTRKTGDLEVSKVLVSDRAADADQAFTFTVTLSDTSITKTFGDMAFENGIATFTLKGGEKAKATGLPIDVTYKVTETAVAGFVSTKSGESGIITEGTSSATFTNTRETGDLVVEKHVTSTTATDHARSFEFTVTLSDRTIGGAEGKAYGAMTFKAGVATFTLKDGQSLRATGLPTDITYEVTETAVEGFDSTPASATGTIGTTLSTASFDNRRDEGGLRVTKIVKGATANEVDTEFAFTVTLDDETITGPYGAMSFEAGVATFALKGGESIDATGLPKGIGYTVTEEDVDGFSQSATGATGTIADAVAIATFTNARTTGNLELTKKVVSDATADKTNKTFTFTVTLADSSIEGVYGDMDFKGGVATVELRHEETAKATGLPSGIGYTITEAEATGFELTGTTKAEGTVPEATTVRSFFTNTRETGDLTVSKSVVSDAAADHTRDFNFTVKLTGAPINGTYGDMTFADGIATVTLKDTESATATGLPTGVAYTVTESVADGFVTTSTGETGTISKDLAATAAFTNTRTKGDLTIKKTVTSSTAADHTRDYDFTVTLSDKTIAGTYGSLTFESGVAHLTLKDNESATATGLPTGITYLVSETTPIGFIVTSSGTTGEIVTTGSTAFFTNTREEGDLIVTKSVESAIEADKDIAFGFTVTLDDTTLSGDYGDMEFVDGVATFTLRSGETKSASGLPKDVGYTVAEDENDLFDTTFEGETGTIGAETATAAFKNTRRTGGFDLSKELVSEATADAGTTYTFTVELSDKTISGTFGDVTFEAGVAKVELKGGEKAEVRGIPTTVGYAVTEAEAKGFDTTSDAAEGAISGTIGEVVFTNTRKTGELTVEKSVVSDATADHTKEFGFTVTLTGAPITGTYGDMEFVDGVATFTLVDGAHATATGLPTDIGYTVVEDPDNGFTMTATGAQGTITDDPATASFVNTRKVGGLSVTKTVTSHTAADRTRDFTFTVNLTGAPVTGTYGGMDFVDGIATFALRDGQTKTAADLPIGIAYAVSEETEDGFVTTSGITTGTVAEAAPTVGVTNTRDEGGLIVSKTVVSDATADHDKAFAFTVTLTGAGASDVTGSYGQMTFEEGVATFELKDTESLYASDLPTGLTYTVTETADDGFTTTSEGATGTIAKTATTAAFTNTRKVTDLSLSKVLVSDAAADADQEFAFTVTLTGAPITGTYGDLDFAEGVAHVTLKGGESATAEGLPTGIIYDIVEDHYDDFITAGSFARGVLADESAKATFTNVRRTGDLTISKELISEAAADAEKVFTFTVTLTDTSITTTEEKTYGDLVFEDGVATVTLKGGESATAEDLPTGIGYTIVEAEADGFELTKAVGAEGTIVESGSLVTFENTRTQGGLTVTKTVTSHTQADHERTYAFTVTLGDTTISGTYGDITFEAGVATFTLTDQGIATAEGLPTDVTYTVEEETVEGITTTSTGETGTIAEASAAEGSPVPAYPEAAFVNARNEGDLEITKTVVGATSVNADKEFFFAVELTGEGVEDVTGDYGDLHFEAGKATAALKGGATVTASGLPIGLAYTVTEQDADGFTATHTGETGTIAADTATAAFTNTYDATGETTLAATKVLDGRPFAEGDAWTFTVTADEGVPMPERTEVTPELVEGETEATIDFGTISYGLEDAGKTYTYTITETGKVEDVVNDEPKTVTVKVTDNGDGTLAIDNSALVEAAVEAEAEEASATSGVFFINRYQIHVPLEATKSINGRQWKTGTNGEVAEEFEFALYDADDASKEMREASDVKNDVFTSGVQHKASFGEFTFTSEDKGTYTYQVAEVAPEDAVRDDEGNLVKDGLTYDPTMYDVVIEVTDDEDGTLVANVTYNHGEETYDELTFTNTYRAEATEAIIEARKAVEGAAAVEAGAFEFELRELNADHSLLQTKRNGFVMTDGVAAEGGAAEAVTFDTLSYSRTGIYHYTINEVIPEGATRLDSGTWTKGGILYDSTVHEVTVTVTDNFDGTLTSRVDYEGLEGDALPTFTNTFGTQSDIHFTKEYYGSDTNAAFGFTLTAADDSFEPRVSETGDVMTYQAANVDESHPVVDGGQAFKVAFTNGAFADGRATVSVPPITYHEAGTYHYLITEDSGDQAKATPDAAELLVTVTVAEDGTSTTTYALRADGTTTALESADDAVFYNNGLIAMAFDAIGLRAQSDMDRVTSFMPKVRKVLQNGFLHGDDFDFELYAGGVADGRLLQTVSNDVNGIVAFDALTYTSADAGQTYTYTIVEKAGTDAGIVYNTDPITLEVKVTEDADGALVAEGTYYTESESGELTKTDDPTIINSYDTIVIHAVKRTREFNEDGTINNEAEGLAHAHYGLWMVNPDGEDVYMGRGRNQLEQEGSELESDENGNLYYDIPLLEGVAYYFLEEWPPPEGHLLDPYRTDYFTLVHNEGGFRLVYENDPSFASYVPGLTD